MNNLNLKIIMKRILAYIIDIAIITIISTLISYIPLFNHKYNKYENLYNEYQNLYTEYTSTTVLLNDIYEDETISEEEYQSLLEKETYKEIIQEKYTDSVITEEEIKNIKESVEHKYNSISEDYNYELKKLGTYNTIIILICTFLYFGVLQYILKGQTIGKKVMSLKIVSVNNKKINLLIYLLRSLIVNNILLNTISVIFLEFTKRSIYIKAESIISIIASIVEASIIFLIITKEDNRGLHDLLCNTKVISTKEEKILNSK